MAFLPLYLKVHIAATFILADVQPGTQLAWGKNSRKHKFTGKEFSGI